MPPTFARAIVIIQFATTIPAHQRGAARLTRRCAAKSGTIPGIGNESEETTT
jgi:hypothetical protein